MNYFDKTFIILRNESNGILLLIKLLEKVRAVDSTIEQAFMNLLRLLVESKDYQQSIGHPKSKLSLGIKDKKYRVLLTYPINEERWIEIQKNRELRNALDIDDLVEYYDVINLMEKDYLIKFTEKYNWRYKQDALLNFRNLDNDAMLLEICINI